jgi:nitroreductase
MDTSESNPPKNNRPKNTLKNTGPDNTGPHVTCPLDWSPLPQADMQARSEAFLATISRRRSVRDFADRAVPQALIENAVKAAGSAPSGAHGQPWHFVAIGNSALKGRIRTAAEKEEQAFYEGRAGDDWLDALAPLGTDANKPFLETAPWLIAVFLEKYQLDDDGTRHKHYYMNESVGMACGLLVTALHLSGLATLTHTPAPMGFLKEVLERPVNERAYMLIVTGYPAEGATVPAIERKRLDEILTVR